MSIYVVTGANRGIGRGVVDKLAKHLKEHSSESIVYLTSRKSEDGEEAVKELAQQGFNNVRSTVLDVTNRESVESLAKFLKEKHPGGIDVLINNAGYASKGPEMNDKIAEDTILPNYYGLKQVTKAILPLIKPNGRVINVTSQAGVLGNAYREDLKQKFLDPNLTEGEIDALVENFRKSVREDAVEQNGWPKSTYKASKVAANAYTRIFARDLQRSKDPREKSIFVAALCPGWVKTRMGGPNASLTVEEGADTPYWLAVESLDKLRDRNGLFWYQRHVISW